MKHLFISMLLSLIPLAGFSATVVDDPAAEDPVSGSASKNSHHVMILFDPLGFITMGPSLHVEPAIGKYVGINAGFRLHNLGLMQNLLFGEMKMSYMGHGSVKFYVKPKKGIDGFFIGPGVEYGRSNYKSGAEYHARAFGGEVGYKWVFRKDFVFEVSDYIGVVQSKRIDSLYSEWRTDMFVFYMLSVKLGKAF